MIDFFRGSANRKLELKQILLTEYTWGFPSVWELNSIPLRNEKDYPYVIAASVMNNFAISLFKKNCSEIGFIYEDVESIYRKQNEQFFNMISVLKAYGRENSCDEEGRVFKNICYNLIVPKVTEVEEVVRAIKRLSPEEQAEAMQLFAGKKIKITVEDI